LANEAELQVRIVDLSGKEIQVHSIQGQTGVNVVLFDTSNLSQGMYMVEIVGAGGVVVRPFVKR